MALDGKLNKKSRLKKRLCFASDNKTDMVLLYIGAQEGTRTPTMLLAST